MDLDGLWANKKGIEKIKLNHDKPIRAHVVNGRNYIYPTLIRNGYVECLIREKCSYVDLSFFFILCDAYLPCMPTQRSVVGGIRK